MLLYTGMISSSVSIDSLFCLGFDLVLVLVGRSVVCCGHCKDDPRLLKIGSLKAHGSPYAAVYSLSLCI